MRPRIYTQPTAEKGPRTLEKRKETSESLKKGKKAKKAGEISEKAERKRKRGTHNVFKRFSIQAIDLIFLR
jgi:hypothetical protein